MLEQYYNRVANWNAARYEQEFDLDLAVRLLKEEYTEWCEAYNASKVSEDRSIAVEMLDAIGDVSFVALGVVWKANIDYATLELAMLRTQADLYSAACTMPQLHPMMLISSVIDGFKYDNDVGIADAMAMIVHLCALEAKYHFSFGTDKFFEIIKAICDSNDTKVVVKAAATEKANEGNKGNSYVPPTKALKALLNEGYN